MKFFERVKETLRKKREKITENIPSNPSDHTYETYDLIQEEKDKEWEEQFEEYTQFPVVENGKTFIISCNFKPDEQKKEQVSKFVKDGLEKEIDLMNIMICVGVIFNLGTAHKGIKKENKILLFFSES